MESDKKVIAELGGPTKVAELLGYPKRGGTQRVQNWITRGIPAKVKLTHPALFLHTNQRVADPVPANEHHG